MTDYHFSLGSYSTLGRDSAATHMSPGNEFSLTWPAAGTTAPAKRPKERARGTETYRLSQTPQTLTAEQATGFAFAMNSAVAALEAKVESLTQEVDRLTELRENLIAEAAGDSVAMFILHKVVEADDVSLDVFVENLTAPYGWIAFAKLWRADLIDCYGNFVMPTDAGVEIARRYVGGQSQVVHDAPPPNIED